MDVTDVPNDRWKQSLAKNVERLMEKAGHRTLKDVTKASKGKVSNGTIGRIKAGQGAKLVTLLDVADLYRVELYQLVAPDIDQTFSEAALNLARAFDALPPGKAKEKAYAICRLQLTPLAEVTELPEVLDGATEAPAEQQTQ